MDNIKGLQNSFKDIKGKVNVQNLAHIFLSVSSLCVLGAGKRPTNEPQMMKERGKYCEQGIFSNTVFNRLNLPSEICEILKTTANMAISNETKKKYHTALNNIEKCEQDLNEHLPFPWSQRSSLIFVGWCIKKDLKTQSIRGYLSGISKMHVALGYPQLDTSTPLMKEIFNGHDNRKAQEEPSKNNKRLPCTLKLLNLLKSEIRLSSIPEKDKLMIWACCTVSFYGALRPGEALSKFENYFDPSLTLCKKDVKIVKGRGGRKMPSIWILNTLRLIKPALPKPL